MAINNPSIIELCKKVDSKYTLCIEASQRAKQLVANKVQPLINDIEGLKPLKIAIKEINKNLITYSRKNNE